MNQILNKYVPFILITLFAILLSTSYLDTTQSLLVLWNSENNPTYSHGLLLIFICLLILLYEWRRNITRFRIEITAVFFISALGILILSIVWMLANVGAVQIIQILVLPVILYLILLSLLGFNQARIFIFPTVLLIGAIPVWEILAPYLQWITAIVSGWVASLTIIPSTRDGLYIYIPAGVFEVEEGCSGLAYFIVSVIISLLYSYLNRHSLMRLLIQLLGAMLVSVIANIIRVYIIILSGQLTDMKSYFITVEHVSLGWVVFCIAITLYLWLSQRYTEGILPSETGRLNFPDGGYRACTLISVGGCLLLIYIAASAGPLMLSSLYDSNQNQNLSELVLAETLGDWKREEALLAYEPVLLPGDAHFEGVYVHPEFRERVYIFINYFQNQRQGHEAVSNLNKISDGYRWQSVSSKVLPITKGDNRDVTETIIQGRDGQKLLVWNWYYINGKLTSLPWKAKIYTILGVLTDEPGVFTVVMATGHDIPEQELRVRFYDLSQVIGSELENMAEDN